MSSPPSKPDDERSIPPDESRPQPRRSGLTPEQRRFLGTSRPVKSEPPLSRPQENLTLPPERDVSAAADRAADHEASAPVEDQSQLPSGEAHPHRSGNVAAQAKAWQAAELRRAILIISLVLFLPAMFVVGRKFDQLKALIGSRVKTEELEGGPDKFPNVTAEELVETGLAAEKRGDWPDAIERYIAAKRKNRVLPGLLFRIGKGSFDRGDLNGADIALGHAIRFGENLPVAYYYRGLIAVQRHDLAAAARNFEAAANAEPFVSDFYYYWGEVLRLDQKPREAIRRYTQAIDRTPSGTDATLCRFKIRLARMEAAEMDAVAQELEEARRAGPLSVDWLMTDAAIQLRSGNAHEAAKLIWEARGDGRSGLFRTCGGDSFFTKAAEAHPEVAAALAPPAPPLG